MNARWSWLTSMGIIAILIVAGCRTTTPDLRPPKQPEVFTKPPENVSNNYPKQAFTFDDNSKLSGLDPGGLQPTGSRGGGMSPGGSGSFGGPGGR